MLKLNFWFHYLHPQSASIYLCALGFGRDSFIASLLFSFFFFFLFACQVLERCRLQKRLSSCPKAPGSDVRHGAESDTVPQSDGEPAEREDTASLSTGEEEPVKEQDLQAQVRVQHKLLWSICFCQKRSWHLSAGKSPWNTHIPALWVRTGNLIAK